MTSIADHDAFFQDFATGPWAAPDDPRHRAAAELRRLAAVVLDERRSPGELEELAAALGALGALGDEPGDGPVTRYHPEHRPGGDRVRTVRPNANGTHPLAGPCNPIAPPIVLRLGPDVVYGDVTYDVRFEGLPGLVQGGFLAAGFDLLLGQGVALSGQGGMTGSLTVRFRAPTPLYEPLRYEARFERGEGRKTFAAAVLVKVADGGVCAEAEGVFIAPRPTPAA